MGDSLTITVPTGATQLQLGINDDIYYDNTGAYNITISGAAVPEPSALALLGLTVTVIIGTRLSRRQAAP